VSSFTRTLPPLDGRSNASPSHSLTLPGRPAQAPDLASTSMRRSPASGRTSSSPRTWTPSRRSSASAAKVALLFVVGEERDSAGATVANQNPRGSRFLINGEPTDNRLALASKGALRVELYAHGRAAHSAYPELGESAIDKLLAALQDIQALPLPIVEGIGDSNMNVGLIHGGRAPNVIADKAEAHILVRLVGPAEETKAAIVKAAAGRCEVVFSLELPFVQMRALPGFETMVAKFTTDIPALTAWGEPFLLGPGSIHVAHTPDEKISKSELLGCVELYVDLAKRLVS
jgi:acetylornithine deacetylase